MFSAYDNSFVLSPTLGLVQQAAIANMDAIYVGVQKDKLDQVSKVMNALAVYSAPCTQVELQSIVDKSIKQTTSLESEPIGFDGGQTIYNVLEIIKQQRKEIEKLRKDADKYEILLEQLNKANE